MKRSEELIESQEDIRKLLYIEKDNDNSCKLGYCLSAGGILNAYRECDISFEEAVLAIETITNPEIDTEHCPACDGTDLCGIGDDYSGDEIYRKIECENCGGTFDEVYKISSVENFLEK